MNAEQKKVVKNLENTYCRIKYTPGKGVGVYAIRDIPKGIDPFKGPKKRKWVKLNMKDISYLDKEILKMVDDFCIIQKNGDVWVYEEGMNGLHIRWFLNHSKKPNMVTRDEALSFKTIREIKKDEELTYDYGSYDWKWK
jgi:hypothetical protein